MPTLVRLNNRNELCSHREVSGQRPRVSPCLSACSLNTAPVSVPAVLNPRTHVPQQTQRGPLRPHQPPAPRALRGFEMNHEPLHLQMGNCNIDPAALGDARLPNSVIRQRLSVWAEHRVHIDLSSVGAESFEMEIWRGN